MNILFTCAGRRNYLLNFFKEELNSDDMVMAADMQLSAPAMAVADKKFVVPAVYSSDYVDQLLDICKNNKIQAIFSLNDLELPLLAARKIEFENLGVKVVVADQNSIEIAFDKWKTIEFATSMGFRSPKTYTTYTEALAALDSGVLNFPLVVKPRWGSGSIGLEFPHNREELDLSFQLLSLRLSRTMLSEVSKADIEHAILIQEKIEGIEYGLDILNDFSGIPRQVYVKEKLSMRSGETDKAVLRNKPQIEDLGLRIGNAFKHIGNLDCDIFEKNGEYYLLELNPRFGGGYPFTHYAGGNYVAALISWLRGQEFDFSVFKRQYDTIYSKCDTLIMVSESH